MLILFLLMGIAFAEGAGKWKSTPTKSWVTKITTKPQLPDLPLDGVCSELSILATVPGVIELCSKVGVVAPTTIVYVVSVTSSSALAPQI